MMGAAEWVPRWWSGEAGLPGRLLSAALVPAELGYRAATGIRNLGYDHGILRVARAAVPVVSVGNLGVGGAGKTPFTAWLAARLVDRGRAPAVVLRGYGADEVVLHRELNADVPVFVAPERARGAAAAVAAGCDVVVLDDGFQHRALARDLDLVLVPTEHGRGRPRLLPRGPWREAPRALRRSDAVLVTRRSAGSEEAAAVAAALRGAFPGLPVLEVGILPRGLAPLHSGGAEPPRTLRGRVLAVAGLADPRPFAANLRDMGAEVELAAYPDHHPYRANEVAALLRRAGDRPIVTTRKDAVKLRPLVPATAPVWVLEQRVEVREVEVLDGLLNAALGEGTR
jgi:tetraacyldisaccharide 4'-kinase